MLGVKAAEDLHLIKILDNICTESLTDKKVANGVQKRILDKIPRFTFRRYMSDGWAGSKTGASVCAPRFGTMKKPLQGELARLDGLGVITRENGPDQQLLQPRRRMVSYACA